MQLINSIVTNVLVRLMDLREEKGQTMVEYGLILALLSIVAAAVLVTLGGEVKGIFQDTANCLNSASGTACS